MDYKLNLITPSLYSNIGPTNCYDERVEKFAHHLKNRSDVDFNLKCKYDHIPGNAFIHSFEDFEERFLIHSEYAVIIASPSSQVALNRFMPRLLVFLTAKPIWQNRFLFVNLGKVDVLSNLVVNDPIEFSMNNWEDHDEESWIKLFDLIKIKWEPHVEKSDTENAFGSIIEQNKSTKDSQSLLKNEIDSGNQINNINNTKLKTEKIDEKTISSNSTFSKEFQTKIDESTNNASDLHGNIAGTGNHSIGKDLNVDNLRKGNTFEKTNTTINVSGIDEANLIDITNKLNTSHEKNMKETNLNVDYREASNLSDEISIDNYTMHDTQGDFKINIINNNDNNNPIHSDIKTNDNSQIKEGIVEKEEALRMIKCASRKLQGSSVSLENMLYFQSNVPINNEPKVYENREMNTDESIFKNKNNISNDKELPPIIEHSKETNNASPLISNQSSCTDSEQTFECDLNDQIIPEQDEEYDIHTEIIKMIPGEFDFQSLDNIEEREMLNEKNNKISLIYNKKNEKEMVGDDIILESYLDLEKTMKVDHSNSDQVSTENLDSKQIKTDEEELILNNRDDYDNKLMKMRNDLNFTVSDQSDKTNLSIKIKDENSVRMNADADIMCSGNEFDKTNEVSIKKSVQNKDDVEFKMSSNENNETLLEVENSKKLHTSIDHEITTHVNLDSNDSRDFSNDFDNFDREVSDDLHLCRVGNSITDESGNSNNNHNNNNNNNNIISSEIESGVKSILNINDSVNKDSIDPNFDENSKSTINNQGFESIVNITGEMQPLEGSSNGNINKKLSETNEHTNIVGLDINNASVDATISEKSESLSGDSSLLLSRNSDLHTELKSNETISGILEIGLEHRDQDNKPEISIDHKTVTQVDLDSNIAGDSSCDINKEVSDNLHLCSVGNSITDESGNSNNNDNNNKNIISSEFESDVKSLLNINESVNKHSIDPNFEESNSLTISNQGSESIVNIAGEMQRIRKSSQGNINKEFTGTNEHTNIVGLDINNTSVDATISEKSESLSGDSLLLLSRNNHLYTELKSNETISSILEIGLEHRDPDNKPEISIDHKTVTQVDLDSNIAGDSSGDLNKEVSDKLHLCNVENLASGESSNNNNDDNDNTTIDCKVNTYNKLILNISENNNENEVSINLQNVINPNLDEGRNLIIENQEFNNNSVDVVGKTTISEESNLLNINKERRETNENIDNTDLEKNHEMFPENIDSLSGYVSQVFNNNFGTEFRNNEIENCDLDIGNKYNEENIDIKNNSESKETEFITQVINDVDSENWEEERKISKNNDYKNELLFSEMVNRQNDDERKSSNREALENAVGKPSIDEFDLDKKGTDVNSLDNKNKIKENEIFSQKIKDLKESEEDFLDISEQIDMKIESRIHFVSDDIDINLYDKKSKSYNYEIIEEESKENMEEESYISEFGENHEMDDLCADQNRSQFMNEHQISQEISPSNNLNNADFYVRVTSGNFLDDKSKYKIENNEKERENYITFPEKRINMNTDSLHEELNSRKNIENGDNFESENDEKNVNNKSTYSFFRIPLNCLRGLNRIFLVNSSNQSNISDMDYEQSSTDTENYLTRCLHSPWCVLLLFVTGTLASPYWVEITRNISQSAVGADLIIDKISSTILHEDSVNRKYAILPLENH